MKKWVAFVFILCLTNSFSQSITRARITESSRLNKQQGKNGILNTPNLPGAEASNNKSTLISEKNLSTNHVSNEILDLYPLATGNEWINLVTTVFHTVISTEITSTQVLGDSAAPNGRYYYHLKENDDDYLERVDSANGNVYRYFEHPSLPENEYVVADLAGEVGDTIIVFDPYAPNAQSYLMVTGADTVYKWGLNRFRKTFLQITESQYRSFSLIEDIGRDHSVVGLFASSYYVESSLRGCIIDGMVLGDTSLTKLEDEENATVMSFRLNQNFPNPFNPATTISYQIPDLSFVTLKVYDVLGSEVTTLVNEEELPGNYQVKFNAGNVASGIYFYQLRARSYNGNGRYFIDTKKMIILR